MKKIATIIVLLCFSLLLRAQTFSWSGFEAIADFQTDTIPVSVSGLPSAIDTTFGIAHICMNITHTYDADLVIKIISPDGNLRTLIQNTGGSGNNFSGTCVGVDGTAFSNASAPYTGLFVPASDISSLNNGQNPNGIWKFIVSDQGNADTGSIHTVSIEFTNNPPRQSGANISNGPTGTYICSTCICPGGAQGCDLLPDMTASAKEIAVNHTETPGFLDIANATPNIGFGPMEIWGMDSCFCGTQYVPCNTVCPNGEDIRHIVKQRIYQKVPGNDTLSFYDRTAGEMEYHSAHNHLHIDNWSSYTLRSATSNPDATTWPIIGTGTKQSFCLINLGTCSGNVGECTDSNGDTITTVPNQNLGFHTGCGLTQGIYVGNYDVYSLSLNDPIPLTNVCNGTYYIVSITDPDNNFLESDETNNWVAVPITLTQQSSVPTISANGSTTICQGDSITLTATTSSNYLWSTGATTQSIVVHNAGSYTVSTDCGNSVGTSTPVTVTVRQMYAAASASPAVPPCNGDAVQLNATATSSGSQILPITFASNQQVFIPDNNSTGVTSVIAVSGINPLTLSSTSIVSVKLNLTHTYDGDLEVSLIAPSGNTIMLSNRRGGSGNNFINTVFTMSASTLISAGSPPFTGNYKPDGNFPSLTGNANGNWYLKVRDLANTDTGRIQNWNIIIQKTVPETLTYAWTSAPAGFTSSIANPVVNPVVPTAYTVTVSSSTTGCSESTVLNVAVPEALTVNSISPSSAISGSIITINGTGFTNATSVTISGTPVSGFMILNPTQIQATIPNMSPATGLVCVTSLSNCSACSGTNLTVNSSVSLNLKLFIQGFYLGQSLMRATVDAARFPTLCDTITVELHDNNSPYSVLFTNKFLLNTSGICTAYIPSAFTGSSYYLAMRHRNAMQTWSNTTVSLVNGVSYDFSNALSKAYGNNQINLGDGNFALWTGDVTNSNQQPVQDGSINFKDLQKVEDECLGFINGYYRSDLNGDGITESADYSLIEVNAAISIILLRP
jgi:subtilisin-like proprotein convertase family protein